MAEYITVTWGNSYGKCVICGRVHDKGFPEDFPEEFKLCCNCLKYAEYIVIGDRQIVEESYSKHSNYFDRVMECLDKIEKLINLVG